MRCEACGYADSDSNVGACARCGGNHICVDCEQQGFWCSDCVAIAADDEMEK